MCASSELQFGALREGGGTREAGSTVAESLVVVLYRVGTHQIRLSEGKLMSDHCHFSERRTGKIRGAFKGAQGFGRLDAGSRGGFTSSWPPPPWTSVFQFSLFLYDMWP